MPQPAAANGKPAERAVSKAAGSKRLASELSSLVAPVVDQPRVRKRPSLLMHEEPGPQLAPSAARAAKASLSTPPPEPAGQEPAEQRAPRRTAVKADPVAPGSRATAKPARAASVQPDTSSSPAKRHKATNSGTAKAATPAQTAAAASAKPQQPPDMPAPAISAPAAGSAAQTGCQRQLPVLQPPLELVLPLVVMPPRPKRQRHPPERLINVPPGRQLASAEDRAADAARRRIARRASGIGGESVSTSGPSPVAHSGGGGGGTTTAQQQVHGAHAAGAAAAGPAGNASPVASSDSAHTPSLMLINKVPETPDDAAGAVEEASSKLRPLRPAPLAVQPAGPSAAAAAADMAKRRAPAPSSAAPSAAVPSLASAAHIRQASEAQSVGPAASGAPSSGWLSLQPAAAACRPQPALKSPAASHMPAISLPRPALPAHRQPPARQSTLPMNPFQSTVDAFLNDDDLLIPNPSAHLPDVQQHGMPLPGGAFAGAAPQPMLQGAAVPRSRGHRWDSLPAKTLVLLCCCCILFKF